MNEGTDNRSRGRSHQKRMYFLLSSTAKDLWPPLLLLLLPLPLAACLLIAGKERKKEGKGKKKGNGAADSAEELRAKERALKGSSSFKVTSTH